MIMHYLACLPATPVKFRGRLHKERIKVKNTENGRLMRVSGLLRVIRNNTERFIIKFSTITLLKGFTTETVFLLVIKVNNVTPAKLS